MTRWKPDPSFYPSPREAAARARRRSSPTSRPSTAPAQQPDAIAVLDADPDSDRLRPGGRLDRPAVHRRRAAPLRVERVQQRALPVRAAPARRAALPDRARPALVAHLRARHQGPTRAPRSSSRRSSAEELAERAGYSRPHTVHCGPDGIYVIGARRRRRRRRARRHRAARPHHASRCSGGWEVDRGPQYLAYDVWWHLGHDVMVTSEWGTPSMIEDGIVGELLLGRKYGHALHFWDLRKRRHVQRVDLGDQYQMVLELRPAHDPTKDLRLRRRGDQRRGPVGVGLAVAPRRRRAGR